MAQAPAQSIVHPSMPFSARGLDEAFCILEGSMTVTCGDKSWDVGAGSFVFLPCGIAHGFTITGDKPLRGLQLTVPSGFEQFIAETGVPADAPVVATGPDVPRLLAAAERHHVVIPAPSEGHWSLHAFASTTQREDPRRSRLSWDGRLSCPTLAPAAAIIRLLRAIQQCIYENSGVHHDLIDCEGTHLRRCDGYQAV